ncbi:DUF2922 family protein [Enterococcus avium]|uniref:DUF2922 family protein n=1 Tax=Enterococcus avium TaxID=33945 RepID=UPI0022E07007|nr:DUF2922 family protein [Enterococcus avium]
MDSIGKTRIRLQVKYEKSNGNYHRFSIKDVNRDLPAEKIKSSLGKLAIVDLFDQDGVGLFKKAVEAKFVETTESKIFDNRNDEDTLQEKSAASENQLIRIPEDLIITEERSEPDTLIQKIGLPKGIDLQELNDQQTTSILIACMHVNAELEDVWLEDNQFTLIERLKS